MGMTAPGLLLALLAAREARHLKRRTRRPLGPCSLRHLRLRFVASAGALAGATAALLAGRMWVQQAPPVYSAWQNPAGFHPSRLARALSLSHLAVQHARLLLLPATLCPDYSNAAVPVIESPLDQRVLPLLVAVAGVAAALALVWRHVAHPDTDAAPLLLGLAWLLLPFVPASNLLFPVGFTLAERVLYSPSIGLCLLAGSAADAFLAWTRSRPEPEGARLRATAKGTAFALLVLLGVRTLLRDLDWSSNERLWSSSVKACPANAVSFGNLGVVRQNQRRWREAEQLYRKAVEIAKPLDAGLSVFNLAQLLTHHGRPREALDLCLPRARRGQGEAILCVAHARRVMGEWSAAAADYRRVFGLPIRKKNRFDVWRLRWDLLFVTTKAAMQTGDPGPVFRLAGDILGATRPPAPPRLRAFARRQLAEVHSARGDGRAVEREARASVKEDPETCYSRVEAVKILRVGKRLAAAREVAMEARRDFPDCSDIKYEAMLVMMQRYLRQPHDEGYRKTESRLQMEVEERATREGKLKFLAEFADAHREEVTAVHAILLMAPILQKVERDLPTVPAKFNFLHHIARKLKRPIGALDVFIDLTFRGSTGLRELPKRIGVEMAQAKAKMERRASEGPQKYGPRGARGVFIGSPDDVCFPGERAISYDGKGDLNKGNKSRNRC